MTWLLSKFSGWLSAAGALIAIVAGAFLYGRREGSQAAKQKQAEADAKAAKTARKVEDDVRKSSDPDIDQRLSKWLRDKR
jgi:hypothetical protein